MAIVLVRIDDRLIHGQVVEGWLKPIRVNKIIVVSDEVAADKMQQILLGMALPSGTKLSIFSVAEASVKISEENGEKDRVMVLFSRPSDVLSVINAGAAFQSVNVGGMHFSEGKQQLLRNLSVDDADITALEGISARGVELEGRVLPTDERISVKSVLSEHFKKNKSGKGN